MPTMRWHPETGEAQTFGPDDPVPEGWLDHHPDDVSKNPAPAVVEDDEDDPNAPLTKREVVAALTEGGLEFNKNAKVADLTEQLVTALKAALKAGNVEFADDTSPRALLALVSVK